MRYTNPHWETAALITIDVHCCTLDGGELEARGTSTALPRMVELAESFRDADRPIVHVVRLYLPDGSNVDPSRRLAVEQGARFLTPSDPGTALPPELTDGPVELDSERLLAGEIQRIGPREVAIYKPRWGAFFQTPLEDHLSTLAVDTLVFCGANFPNCPRTSIYEASERDFRVVAASDGISGIYERGERELAGIGTTLLTTAEISAAVRDHAEALTR
jgi:nicotinamidase-related amidase